MGRTLGPWLLAAGLALDAGLAAGPLAKPAGLSVSAGDATVIRWEPVEGAALYRVAVFDEPDADGKRPLLAAVWVRGDHWDYARGTVVPRAGRLASTKPLPLPPGRTLRVMVAAAREGGADKSEWSGEDLRLPAAAAPSPTVTPTVAPTEGHAGSDAEIELEGGEEFKSVPEPAVLEVEDGAAAASGAAADGSTAGATPTAQATAEEAPSLARAKALLQAGRFEDAEAQFRVLLKNDENDADAWEGLGDSLAARRMKAEAYEAYSRALKLDGDRERLRDWIRKNVPRR
jgi:tetratricopeptide (TPR) repeat protein